MKILFNNSYYILEFSYKYRSLFDFKYTNKISRLIIIDTNQPI